MLPDVMKYFVAFRHRPMPFEQFRGNERDQQWQLGLKLSAESDYSLQQGSNAEVIQASSQIWRYVARWLSFNVSEHAMGKESRLRSEVGSVPLVVLGSVPMRIPHIFSLALSPNRYPHRGARFALIPPSGAVTALPALSHSPSCGERRERSRDKTLLQRPVYTPVQGCVSITVCSVDSHQPCVAHPR